MRYYYMQSLRRQDPFFGDPQQTSSRSSSLQDIFPARVLLEAEMRYANVLAQNGVEKLSIFCGWHRSPQYRDEHYTLRGYDRAGWMVVTLEMKVGNAGRWFEYGPREQRRWLRNARNGRPLASKHFFRDRDHMEAWGIWDRVSCPLAALDILTLRSQWMSVAIEVPVEDLFVGYMIAQLCKPEIAHL
ncbi:hypothetical protein IW261DRAFT_1416223 [Armillaria novae-zelandiae]|uniref:Uncharacterized protein n=1 Tax=Armillaria novae-zelandiae TaxID=153914 RepID=A0AA39PNK5_9AGAR|nr:hypothetical protein IW261DRAFT_1416223 [Armillaria novae-zelandiae]